MKKNFQNILKFLKTWLDLLMEDSAVPMVYPYLTDRDDLRSKLQSERIYVATYWPNVLRDSAPGSMEYCWADRCLPLPIDQRYGTEDMQRIIESILS